MKVQLTVEVTDDEMIAVGLLTTGLFIPATRVQIRETAEEVLSTYFTKIGDEVSELKTNLRDELLAKLTEGERAAIVSNQQEAVTAST